MFRQSPEFLCKIDHFSAEDCRIIDGHGDQENALNQDRELLSPPSAGLGNAS